MRKLFLFALSMIVLSSFLTSCDKDEKVDPRKSKVLRAITMHRIDPDFSNVTLETYYFKYDSEGRIVEYSYGSGGTITYADNEVKVVSGSQISTYKLAEGKAVSGEVTTSYNPSGKSVMTFTYQGQQFTSFLFSLPNAQVKYTHTWKNGMIVSSESTHSQLQTKYEMEYNSLSPRNDTNIDMTSIYSFGLGPNPGILEITGERSQLLPSKVTSQQQNGSMSRVEDFAYEYDSKGRLSRVWVYITDNGSPRALSHFIDIYYM